MPPKERGEFWPRDPLYPNNCTKPGTLSTECKPAICMELNVRPPSVLCPLLQELTLGPHL